MLAIRQKAYAEGKQRDQAWILDLVAANLARDALEWHASLEPAVQNDWLLLQKALLARFCGTFKGIDGIECERFIQYIRRRTFAEGKAGDNDWIVQLVACCVEGDAMRWHASLFEELAGDWKLLLAAMLDRYPPPEVRGHAIKRSVDWRSFRDPLDLRSGTSSPIIPVPASAAPAPTTLKTGWIRFVYPGNPTLKAYLSRTPHATGYIALCYNSSDALAVEYDPSKSSNTIGVKVCAS